MVRWKPGDVVAAISGDRVELVRVSKCNSQRVVSYLRSERASDSPIGRPGRKKPVAATTEDVEVCSIGLNGNTVIPYYQTAAGRLYDKGLCEFASVEECRRAIVAEAEQCEMEDL